MHDFIDNIKYLIWGIGQYIKFYWQAIVDYFNLNKP